MLHHCIHGVVWLGRKILQKMAVFLAGEGASFCTGSRKCFLRFNMTGADRSTEFVVDGGYTAR